MIRLTLTCNPDIEETADLLFVGQGDQFHEAVVSLFADFEKKEETFLLMPELYDLIGEAAHYMDIAAVHPKTFKHTDMDSQNDLYLKIETVERTRPVSD